MLSSDDSEWGVIERIFAKELGNARFTKPRFIGYHRVRRAWNARGGAELSLVFVCFLEGEYTGEGTFFPIGSLLANTIYHHQIMFRKVRRWLETGKQIHED